MPDEPKDTLDEAKAQELVDDFIDDRNERRAAKRNPLADITGNPLSLNPNEPAPTDEEQ